MIATKDVKKPYPLPFPKKRGRGSMARFFQGLMIWVRSCYCFTRWAEDDITGRLLKEYPDQWELVRIPALTDEDYLANIDGNSCPDDPRTKVDEPLWPISNGLPKHGAKKLMQVRDQSPLIFQCLYNQNPTPSDGNMIKKDWLETVNYTFRQSGIVWNFYIDPAYTEKTMNDPSALMCAGTDGQYLYIKDVKTVRMELYELLDEITKFCEKNDYTMKSRVYVEPKASGLSVIQALQKGKQYEYHGFQVSKGQRYADE